MDPFDATVAGLVKEAEGKLGCKLRSEG